MSASTTQSRARVDATFEWLLEGDPAVRWQVMRDLLDLPANTVGRERRRVATAGAGARLLALQDEAGTWAGGLYTPKWKSTTYTLLLLRDFGLPPEHGQARRACTLLLDRGFHRDGGINLGWRGPSETCVTGMVLSLLSYFRLDDDRLDAIAAHLLAQQMGDGGWNCRRPKGATHSSVHTTISVLEGLRWYELHRRQQLSAVRAAQRQGREFLLAHRLFRSHRTGRVIRTEFTRFAFPPRWHYDVLRALDHFQAVAAPRDPRLAEAIELVRARRASDGRWPLQNVHRGQTWFELEEPGLPSRWNTLRALRVLRWWEG